MQRLVFFIFFCIVILSATPINAEFYKFKDQNGTVIFTDDILRVPEDQRPDVQVYKSSKSLQPEKKKLEQALKKTDPITDEMEKKREWLINEQNALNLEKDALTAQKKSISTSKDQEIYNQRVNSLNTRIDAFKEKLTNYNKANE